MQFRCYSCGFKFHDGPPPLEALSDAQFEAVFNTPRFDLSTIVMPPKFEGLTPYNFCAFCLVLVLEFPSTFQDIEGHEIHWETDHSRELRWQVVFCECGELHQLDIRANDDAQFDPAFSWKANRHNKLHKAQTVYTNGDFTLATDLVNKEI